MEIYDLMESYYRRERLAFKRQINHDFVMCSVLTRYMFRKDEEEIPHPWDHYPELFAEERETFEHENAEKEFTAMKERRRKRFQEINRRRQIGK